MVVQKRGSNTYENGDIASIGANSAVFLPGNLVTKTGGYLAKSAAGEKINGTCKNIATMASDNQTVAQVKVVYSQPKKSDTFMLTGVGEKITFAGALVTSNVINMNVNDVAMTPVTFITSNDATLDAIATQLETDFPTLIGDATRTTTRVIEIQPLLANTSVVISDIVVTLGAGQTTGVVTLDAMVQADEGKFYDITTTTQFVDISSAHATSGQLRLERFINGTTGKFSIKNT